MIVRDSKGRFLKGSVSPWGFKNGHTPWHKGKHGVYSKEQIENLRKVHRGNTYRLGAKLSEETKRKIGLKSLGRNKGKHFTKYGESHNLLSAIKQSSKYRSWRLEVYRKDGYSCKLCGSRDAIRAHHVFPMKEIYLKFLEENIGKTFKELYLLAMDYEHFWNVDYGMTVCDLCHGSIHGKGGKNDIYKLRERSNEFLRIERRFDSRGRFISGANSNPIFR